jgi:hypothetical protein
LTLPYIAEGGQVGFLAVDPLTGEIYASSATLAKITHKADRFTGSK